MNTKLVIPIFIVSVFVVGISFYFLFIPVAGYYPDQWIVILLLVLFLTSISYINVSIIFVAIRNYYFLKREFYQKPLEGYKKIIERDPKWTADLANFTGLCTIINFFIVSLFIMSPLVSILEELPYFHLINLPVKLDDKLFNNPLSSTDIAFMFGIIFTGPIFLFILRQLRYKLTRCDNMKRYPGSRILVIFVYVVSMILMGNILSHYIQTGAFVISSDALVNLYRLIINLVIMFGLVVSTTIWIVDRKLFAK